MYLLCFNLIIFLIARGYPVLIVTAQLSIFLIYILVAENTRWLVSDNLPAQCPVPLLWREVSVPNRLNRCE